jgi:hypothetical protein
MHESQCDIAPSSLAHTAKDMERLPNLGVDGLITDQAALAPSARYGLGSPTGETLLL